MSDKEVLVPVRWLDSLVNMSESIHEEICDDMNVTKLKGFISSAKTLIKNEN